MGEISFLLGGAFLNQTTRGTPTTMATIGSGSGASGAIDNATDGAVLGAAGAGVGETGISFSLGKAISEKAVQTGSFTRDFANYVSRTVESFAVTIPMKGNGETTTATPVASDFIPDVGIVALLRAAGLTGGAVGAIYEFAPASTQLITAALYFGNESSNGGRIILQDCEATGLTFNFTPGEVATAQFDLAAVFGSYDEGGSWPANPFDYGNQSSLSAPAVRGVGFTWGPDTPAARAIGFSDLTISIDNQSETIPSSNASSGSIIRQTGREIRIAGTIDADDGEFLYELDQLGESSIANAEALTFTVGTAATGSDPANAYSIQANDPELVSLEPAKQGNSQSWTIELIARAATANNEFSLFYL
jgi:hypothetical protein